MHKPGKRIAASSRAAHAIISLHRVDCCNCSDGHLYGVHTKFLTPLCRCGYMMLPTNFLLIWLSLMGLGGQFTDAISRDLGKCSVSLDSIESDLPSSRPSKFQLCENRNEYLRIRASEIAAEGLSPDTYLFTDPFKLFLPSPFARGASFLDTGNAPIVGVANGTSSHPFTNVPSHQMLSFQNESSRSNMSGSRKRVHRVRARRHWEKKKGLKTVRRLRVKESRSRTCDHLLDYNIIVDFTCTYIWSKNYFHSLFDCIVGNFELFEAAQELNGPETLILLPRLQSNSSLSHLRNIFHVLMYADPLEGHFYAMQNFNPRVKCYYLHNSAKVIYTSMERPWLDFINYNRIPDSNHLKQAQNQIVKRFRKKVELYSSAHSKLGRTIVYVARYGLRHVDIAPVLDIMKKKFPDLPIITYTGAETFKETISIFYSAEIVIGFHGAGLVNTIFCRAGTLIVEFSIHAGGDCTASVIGSEFGCFRNGTSKVLPPLKASSVDGESLGLQDIWRSNNVVGQVHGELIWLTYAIQFPSNALEVKKIAEKHPNLKSKRKVDMNIAFQYLRSNLIELNVSDVSASVRYISIYHQIRQSRLNQNKTNTLIAIEFNRDASG